MSTPSIEEVAAAAGVHKSTVSRAFSRPEAVKEQTRTHVLQVAASMGYTMSPLAQALRTKTSTLVPLIVPDITNPFFAELAKAMTAAAGERGYQLVLCVTENDAAATAGYLDAMQSMYAPFGVIAPFAQVDPAEFEPFGFGKRLVVIDRVESDVELPTVTVDSERGIQLAFEHLLALGHTSIAYLSGISGTHTAADRRHAYQAMAERHSLASIELSSGIGLDAGERATEDLIRMPQRPSAIIAANDMVAFGLISALGARGLSVPDDVSVVGFDGLTLGARSNPPLTSVQQPIAEMGRIAIDLAERPRRAAESNTSSSSPNSSFVRRRGRSGEFPTPARTQACRSRRVHGSRPRRSGGLLRRGPRRRGAVPFPSRPRSVIHATPLRCAAGRVPGAVHAAVPAEPQHRIFQWHSADKRPDHPRHSDRGGHHLCLIVDDVDDAVAHLRTHPRRARCSAAARKSAPTARPLPAIAGRTS